MVSDARKHILFVNPRLAGGGAERVIVNLLRNLDEKKFKLSLAIVDLRDEVFLNQIPDHVCLIDLKSLRVRNALAKIFRLIWRTKPDIVFSTLSHMNVALAAMKPVWPKNTRLVVRPTFLISETFRASPKKAWLWRRLFRLFMPWADGFVFQSKALRDDFETSLEIKARNGYIISNPLDLAVVRMRAQEISSVQLPKHMFNIVAVGRLSAEKGIDVLIDAFARLHDSRAQLTLVGEGELLNALKERVEALNISSRTSFAGFQSNPYAVMAQADVLVLPSRSEGFPNVVLEAMACEIPVIASDLPGLSELIRGVAGCQLVPIGDVAALTQAIERSMSEVRLPVPNATVDGYDVRTVCAAYEDAFLSISRA